ncbi:MULTISPECIES: hypothetical protein [unclassified Erwinia]|uniref:hypothetical protein n=1 Tax=unclassified Erwinia TaxID=2622719 RepID=UPI000C1A279D|nr:MULTISPECIES: hypothetical protein [unclassified Erwinia]PIJ49189.1 hypothetical protein BV501_13765 [Erwinia sp. OAMSP11]PIJ79904.1 hypothetical protein BLD47_12585 [Erwinia sp. OLCASP19]PIJ81072.1 hypothetical protein BLD46_13395 [Erwinia sp. OLMTSP26]PIJ93128.1 hypothetical protein BL249_05240 [Erwinia sp. OLFS4]
MALKFALTKEEFDALDDSTKSLYGEKGEGYQLSVEGAPDVDGLQQKNAELLKEKAKWREEREASAKLAKEKEAEAQKLADEQARKKGDLDTLEKSWAEKLSVRERELMAQIEERDGKLHTLLVDNVAQSMATKLAGDSAAILTPHIKSRLVVEDGKTRVVDETGSPSAATLEELEKEFRNNKLFAPVVIGSKASGTRGNNGLTIASGGGKKWSDYSEIERVQLFKENPEEFKRLQATQ